MIFAILYWLSRTTSSIVIINNCIITYIIVNYIFGYINLEIIFRLIIFITSIKNIAFRIIS